MKTVDCDYFIVGSGMAGLMSALHLASYGKVTVVTKGRLQDCNSNFAQGGICCVMDPEDSFAKHARDTMIAGAWLGMKSSTRSANTPRKASTTSSTAASGSRRRRTGPGT